VSRTLWCRILAGALAATTLVACDSRSSDGRKTITLWTHAAGNAAELSTIEQIIKDFNASQSRYTVVHEAFPQGAYNDAVTAAAASGDLPCVLDVDGPVVANWAWAGYLAPLDLPPDATKDFLPSTLGRYKDKLYSVGFWDVALTVFARRSVLTSHKIRIPTVQQPWTGQEFDAALVTLKSDGRFKYALDLGTGGGPGEWWSYAFSPMLASFGGDLIDRSSMSTAEDTLNGPDAVRFGQWWQSLFTRKLANPQEATDRVAFLNGTAALAWNGNWGAKDAIDKFGDDALFLPPPDFGKGPKIGGASWQWAISNRCREKAGAHEYLRFSLDPKYQAAFSAKIGLIPATEAAAAQLPEYRSGGRYRVFVDYARAYALIRPPTPAYPVISSVFDKAVRDLMNGAPVKSTLDNAVDEIDKNLRSNDNYGF
jgi:multiple sugar transport system substrate-binding protein